MAQMTVLAKSLKRAEQCVGLKSVVGRFKNKFVCLGQIYKQRLRELASEMICNDVIDQEKGGDQEQRIASAKYANIPLCGHAIPRKIQIISFFSKAISNPKNRPNTKGVYLPHIY